MQARLNSGYSLLLLTALLWGFAFVFQRHAAQLSHYLLFNTWRFLLGAVAVAGLVALRFWLRPQDKHVLHGPWFVFGAINGVMMSISLSLQQSGLAYTHVGKASFLAGLYVVFTPFIAALFGAGLEKKMLIAMALAVSGMFCFSGLSLFNNTSDLTWNLGDSLVLGSALVGALEVLWLGFAVRRCDTLMLLFAQMIAASCSTFLLLQLLVDEAFWQPELLWIVRWDIFYTGVISCAFAYWLQALGQRRVPASHAALILSLESVFGLLAGWLFLKESLSAIMLLGCALMFMAILAAQWDDVRHLQRDFAALMKAR